MKKDFLLYCKREKRRVWIIIILASIMMGTIIYGQSRAEEPGILKSEGGIEGLDSEKLGGRSITIKVTAEKNGKSITKNVILSPGRGKEKKAVSRVEKEEPEDAIKSELDELVREINKTEGGEVLLPTKTEKGLALSWEEPDKGKIYYLPPVAAAFIILSLYVGEKEKNEKRMKEERMEIISCLPGFNNKLLLLLESGTVYEDAIRKIAAQDGNLQSDFLVKKLRNIIEECGKTGRDPTAALGRYAEENKIRELSRLVGLIQDNRYKGADLRGKLKSEGEMLWEKRIKQAEDRGRKADTKLALPLGIMLGVLVIVTAAPALMQM